MLAPAMALKCCLIPKWRRIRRAVGSASLWVATASWTPARVGQQRPDPVERCSSPNRGGASGVGPVGYDASGGFSSPMARKGVHGWRAIVSGPGRLVLGHRWLERVDIPRAESVSVPPIEDHQQLRRFYLRRDMVWRRVEEAGNSPSSCRSRSHCR